MNIDQYPMNRIDPIISSRFVGEIDASLNKLVSQLDEIKNKFNSFKEVLEGELFGIDSVDIYPSDNRMEYDTRYDELTEIREALLLICEKVKNTNVLMNEKFEECNIPCSSFVPLIDEIFRKLNKDRVGTLEGIIRDTIYDEMVLPPNRREEGILSILDQRYGPAQERRSRGGKGRRNKKRFMTRKNKKMNY